MPVACFVFALIGLALGPLGRPRREDGRLRHRHRRHLRLLRRDVPRGGSDAGALSRDRDREPPRLRELPVGAPGTLVAEHRPRRSSGLPRSSGGTDSASRQLAEELPARRAAAARRGGHQYVMPADRSSARQHASGRGPRQTRKVVVVVRVPEAAPAGAGPPRSLRQPDVPARRRARLSRAPGTVLHLHLHRRVRQAVQGNGERAAP